MSSNNTYLKVRLHVMSPLHIGCDSVYEPTSFVIDDVTKKLIAFDPVSFVKMLNTQERADLVSIVDKGDIASIIKLYQFVYSKKSKITGKTVSVASGVINRYRDVKRLSTKDARAIQKELNKFEIDRTAYNPHSNLPYIPGSSIKGAMRTGYLSMLALAGGKISSLQSLLQDSNYAVNPIEGQRKARDLERLLLQGVFAEDPFTNVKVSDFLPIDNVNTKISYAVNKKKKPSDKRSAAESGPPQIFEALESGSVFEGDITIKKPLSSSMQAKMITRETLLGAVHKHFVRNLIAENAALKAVSIKRNVGPLANTAFEDTFKKSAYMFRLGRHSGAEAVTIEGNRSIKIMRGRGCRPDYLPNATTFWLASDEPRPAVGSDLTPFGWSVLEILNA